ncbi:hypothetical protein JOF29_007067 [Kribbella aluminosa]|uniref:FAD dependent oxidoreductase n=1 Tax=Kribbella aluminosa TaxID=416017 RepID=A0ABS4UWE1_9ACTN|nr:hypothetical protein [Kribbella aluminosa]
MIAPGAWAKELVPGAAAHRVIPRRVVQGWYLAHRPEDFHPDRFGVFERVGDLNAYGFPSLDGATVKVGIKFETHPEIDDLGNVSRTVDPAFALRLADVVRVLPGLRPDPVSPQTGIEGIVADLVIDGASTRDIDFLAPERFEPASAK